MGLGPKHNYKHFMLTVFLVRLTFKISIKMNEKHVMRGFFQI